MSMQNVTLKPESITSTARPGCGWKCNIKISCKEIICESVDSNQMTRIMSSVVSFTTTVMTNGVL
jgi:hypothetical protein